MAEKNFKVTVRDVPQLHLVGNWMSLNAAADQDDYETLWQVFSNRLSRAPGLSDEARYGVCVNLQENMDCKYWTAIESHPGRPVPRGMVPFAVGNGTYACISGDGRVTLDEAYDYLCNHWEKSQSAFAVDRHKPCVERFESNGSGADSVTLFVPLKPRSSGRAGAEQPSVAAA